MLRLLAKFSPQSSETATQGAAPVSEEIAKRYEASKNASPMHTSLHSLHRAPRTASARNTLTAASRPLPDPVEAASRRNRPDNLGEFVLARREQQWHNLTVRVSLAPFAGTLGCRHRHW